jgi:hypothetical protein
VYAQGSIIPSSGSRGIWLLAALLGLLLGKLLVEPFYTRPVEAMANAIAVLVATAYVDPSDFAISVELASGGKALLLAYGVLVALASVFAIALKDLPAARQWGEVASDTARSLGRTPVIYSVLYFASVYATFGDSAERVFVLLLAWAVVALAQPVESALAFARRLAGSKQPKSVGVVIALEDPRTVLVRLPDGPFVEMGRTVALGSSGKPGKIADLSEVLDEPVARVYLETRGGFEVGTSATVAQIGDAAPIVGYVAEHTDLEQVTLRCPSNTELDLRLGRLVRIPFVEIPVLFQVFSAEIIALSEFEIDRRLVEVSARKLGTWNTATTRFERVEWLPEPGSPAELMVEEAPSFEPTMVGHVPMTKYGVGIDIHAAVTHNTAVLGILGIGKTFLAWELVHRMLVGSIKVVVLDITGKYSPHFSDVIERAHEQALATRFNTDTATNYVNRKVRVDDAGNHADFKRFVREELNRFMRSSEPMLVLNPNAFRVSRMEGRPYGDEANLLVPLTMVEVTRIVAERLLDIAQTLDREELEAHPRESEDEEVERARVCLVLEEAHSLVPEWNSVSSDAEKQAANGTARALLQGRKYGYGTLLVTQRTANVTKSILNQCNTVFAMRVFDATGVEFLSNYIGKAYSKLLATLADRETVYYGRASTCRDPLVITVNNHKEFMEQFWQQRLSPRSAAPAQPEVLTSDHDAHATPGQG